MSVVNPLSNDFSQTAKRVWYWPVIRGAIAVIAGIIAWVWPYATAVVLVWILGIFVLVDGIIEIVHAMRSRGSSAATWHWVIGLLGLAFGIVLVVWPGKTAQVVVWFIGLWAIITGIVQIGISMGMRNVRGSGWGLGLFAGILSVLFGILVLINVGAGLATIVWLIATFVIVWGVVLILFGFQVRSLSKK